MLVRYDGGRACSKRATSSMTHRGGRPPSSILRCPKSGKRVSTAICDIQATWCTVGVCDEDRTLACMCAVQRRPTAAGCFVGRLPHMHVSLHPFIDEMKARSLLPQPKHLPMAAHAFRPLSRKAALCSRNTAVQIVNSPNGRHPAGLWSADMYSPSPHSSSASSLATRQTLLHSRRNTHQSTCTPHAKRLTATYGRYPRRSAGLVVRPRSQKAVWG